MLNFVTSADESKIIFYRQQKKSDQLKTVKKPGVA
jgi:hypothetical protein